jgi:cytoskeleton protein RodZ
MQTAFPPSSLGQRLRAQRLNQNKSIHDVASQLKLPATIVEAMECDDHHRLGAAVFARGRLSSYARLLGVPVDAVDSQFAQALIALPALVSGAPGSRVERSLQRFSRQSIYIVLAAAMALLVVWLGAHQPKLSRTSLAVLDGTSVTEHNAVAAAAPDGNNGELREAHTVQHLLAGGASLRPNPGTNSSAGGRVPATASTSGVAPVDANNALQLRFSGDSWIDIVGVDGHVIEHDTVQAGSVRSYPTTTVASVEIGNPGAVQVLRNGRPLDLRSFPGANAKRFTLSSGGEPAPARD